MSDTILQPIGKCLHCNKSIYDNGSVAVHLASHELVQGHMVQEQFCDETKQTIAESSLIAEHIKGASYERT